MSQTWNGGYYFNFDEEGGIRSWEDAKKYGFVSAGGGARYTGFMQKTETGTCIWVYMPKKGYLGVGTVAQTAKPAREAEIVVDRQNKNFYDLQLEGHYSKGDLVDKEEYIIFVDWGITVPLDEACWEKGFYSYKGIMCSPRADNWAATTARLRELWSLE